VILPVSLAGPHQRRSRSNTTPGHRNPTGPGLAAQTAADQAGVEEAERLAYVAAHPGDGAADPGPYGPAKDQQSKPAGSPGSSITSGPVAARGGLPCSRSPCQRRRTKEPALAALLGQAQIGESPPLAPIPERTPRQAAWGPQQLFQLDHGASSAQGACRCLIPLTHTTWRRAVNRCDHQRKKSQAGEESALADEQQPSPGRWLVCGWGPSPSSLAELRPAIACTAFSSGGSQLPARRIQATTSSGA